MKEESADARALHQKRAFSYKLLEEQHKKYIDPVTGLIKSEYVEPRLCPVCDSDDHISVLNKRGGQYVKCRVCTMLYTNPVPTQETLNKYYSELDTKQGDIVQGESPFYREIYSRGLDAIERQKPSGSLLDVGCSTGFFLDIAAKRGWGSFGVEPGKIEAEECRAKGHTLYVDVLEHIKFDRRFDAITLWDVFEHIPNGKNYLDLLGAILEKGGVLFMQIPNSDSLAPRIMRERCNMFDGLEHCSLYNPSTIQRISESRGFEILDMKSVISEIAVMNNFLSYEDPYFGESSYKNADGLLGFFPENFIHEHLLGYKLQVVLKKT